uniref:Uncharacterized protein n=1 Tax=Opuntia streptacantha TaxID=393608 RepID=A0A7C9ASQ6_OPUST
MEEPKAKNGSGGTSQEMKRGSKKLTEYLFYASIFYPIWICSARKAQSRGASSPDKPKTIRTHILSLLSQDEPETKASTTKAYTMSKRANIETLEIRESRMIRFRRYYGKTLIRFQDKQTFSASNDWICNGLIKNPRKTTQIPTFVYNRSRKTVSRITSLK